MRRFETCAVLALAAVALAAACGCSASGVDGADGSALGTPYAQALDKMRAYAPDAKLVAVRTSAPIGSAGDVEWMYLFATQKEMGLYSVFSAGEQSSVGVVDDEAYADEVFEGIPDVGEVAVDSDAAYELARATLPEGFGDTLCNAYLMLSSLEGDDSSEGAMEWVFEFEPADEAEGEAGEDRQETVTHVCAVDARTGNVAVGSESGTQG